MIVYLHGFASGPASSKAQYFQRRFAELGIEVRVPDLAEGDFEHLTLTRQLRVIERLCGGSPATLIGSSMGGYLAALYAARHPEIQRLVLMAPAFGFARRWPAPQAEEWKRNGYLILYHYGERRDRKIAYGLLQDAACYEDYADFSQPALIFHGRQDTVVPPECSQEFAAARPNVRLELLESDHELLNVLPHMWEQARGFIR